MSQKTLHELGDADYNEKITIEFNQQKVEEDLNDQVLPKDLKVSQAKIVVLAPKMFSNFIKKDQSMVDIYSSFNLEQNFDNIYQETQSNYISDPKKDRQKKFFNFFLFLSK